MKALENIRNQYIFAIIFISTMANDSMIPFAISVFTFLGLTYLTEKLKSDEIQMIKENKYKNKSKEKVNNYFMTIICEITEQKSETFDKNKAKKVLEIKSKALKQTMFWTFGMMMGILCLALSTDWNESFFSMSKFVVMVPLVIFTLFSKHIIDLQTSEKYLTLVK